MTALYVALAGVVLIAFAGTPLLKRAGDRSWQEHQRWLRHRAMLACTAQVVRLALVPRMVAFVRAAAEAEAALRRMNDSLKASLRTPLTEWTPPVEDPAICGQRAAACRCAKAPGHVEAGDEIHACDPSECTGSWTGTFNEWALDGGSDFRPVTLPTAVTR